MKKLHLLCCMALLYNCLLFAQELPEIIPPSPEVSKFAENSSVNVGFYTGTMQTSIPLYNLQGRKLSIPITLDYSTNGVKVNDMSTWVGTGWNLNYGGMISRTIKGEKDEIHDILDVDSNCMYSWELTYLQNDHSDFEADIFTCNILGNSFTFFLDGNNQPVFQELNDYTIEYDFQQQEFSVKDTSGTIYLFGGGDEWNENSTNVYTEITGIGSGSSFVSGITSWYLRKIVHHSGEEITFQYTPEYYTYPLTESFYDNNNTHIGTMDSGPDPCLYPTDNYKVSKPILKTNGLYLNKITTINDELNFSLKDRVDNNLHSKILDKITGNKSVVEFDYHDTFNNYRYFLKDLNFISPENAQNLLKEYSFLYESPELLPSRITLGQDHWGYYNGQDSNVNLLINTPDFPQYSANRDVDETTLKYGVLKEITYPTGGQEFFEYEANGDQYTEPIIENEIITITEPGTWNLDIDAPTHNQTVSFTPNQDGDYKLTLYSNRYIVDGNHYNSQMHYTFKNVTTNTVVIEGDHVPAMGIVELAGNNLISSDDLIGGDLYELTIVAQASEAFLSAKIEYPGISQTFTKYYGGLRLKKRTSKPIIGNDIVKEYTYQDPNLNTTFDYTGPDMITTNCQVGVGYVWKITSSRESREYYNSYDYFYTKVSEVNVNDSQIIHYFNRPNLISLTLNKMPYSTTSQQYQDSDFVMRIGKPTEYKTEYLNIQKETPEGLVLPNPILKKYKVVENFYNHQVMDTVSPSYIRDRKTTLGQPTWPWDDSECNPPVVGPSFFETQTTTINCCYLIGNLELYKYYIQTYQQKLEKTIEKNYLSSQTDPVVVTTEYFYEGTDHHQVTRNKVTTSTDDILETKSYFPKDISQVGGLLSNEVTAVNSLVTQNRYEPIEIESYNNSSKTGTLRNIYSDTDGDGTAYVSKVKTSKGDVNYTSLVDRVEYLKYDEFGNPLEVLKTDGTHMVYIWGYNKTYPIAKIENATYASIETYIPAIQAISDTENSPTQEEGLRQAIMSLGYGPEPPIPHAMITAYTYDPLIGITSVTDPRRRTIFYHYDEFQRLKYVSDHEGKILSENEFNYKN